MSLQEKLAMFTLIVFIVATMACGILITAGPTALGWNMRHIFLMCLAFTAIAHIVRLIYYVVLRKSAGKTDVVSDDRDREIRAHANGIALKLGLAVLFLGSMAVFIINTYTEKRTDITDLLLLVVLIASLILMLTQSLASIHFYRAQKG